MFLTFFFLGYKVDGMDALAVKQVCKFAKEHALKNGPIVSFIELSYHNMSKFFV